jgi:hypothetical protein
MPYVLRRADQGRGLVADMRMSTTSYTHDIRKAKQYRTREDAIADSCPGNEGPVSIDDLLRRN